MRVLQFLVMVAGKQEEVDAHTVVYQVGLTHVTRLSINLQYATLKSCNQCVIAQFFLDLFCLFNFIILFVS